ncbi:MAG: Protoporphyrinogen IX dehydrogenase [menaquinone] [Candidatus Celerinatantimonas neptuna]|nr:MAG: Protoporphyrinogen IX dehydrogenase [menaquinone] [Candidatus Celerinatantimonas neptuna]
MTILICYSSSEGHTRKIVQEIADQQSDADIQIVDLSDTSNWLDPVMFDKVLIGASIHYGKFRPMVHQYVKQYESKLNQIPSAFLGVCLTARKPGKDEPDNSVYMRKFAQGHQWTPQLRAMFAGALRYSVYNWWQTKLIQMIMKITGGSTDKSKDVEFTNWQKVSEFAKQFDQLS